MIKQLSPDEARILKFASRRFTMGFFVVQTYHQWMAADDFGKKRMVRASNYGPYSLVGFYAGCGRLKAMPALLGNLVRLSIFEAHIPTSIPQQDAKDLLDDPIISDIRDEMAHYRKDGLHEDCEPFGYDDSPRSPVFRVVCEG